MNERTPVSGQRTLARAALVLSVLLAGLLAWVYLQFGSQLALALASDSVLDVAMAAMLLLTVRVARTPADEDHPFGHQRAEPLGAVVVAIVAGVLAIEVLRSAVGALLTDARAQMDWMLLYVFVLKIVAKAGLGWWGMRVAQRANSPAAQAIAIDSRNDVIAASLAVAGFFAARYGWPQLDAWLAIPAAFYIGYGGWELAEDNIKLLMGESPPAERIAELEALAESVPEVVDIHDLRAQYLGTRIHVHLHCVVDPELSLARAHDIGEAVRLKLEAESDVGHVAVHLDTE